MKSKQEVRDFLNTLIGLSVNAKTGQYQGQCVSLIKALFEFLGVPDPYAARGDAKDAGNAYLAQDIAEEGAGWLTVVINPNMGGGYGHIWLDLKDEANYEQNGAKALHTTKNTRPWKQGVQYINLDKWLSDGGNMKLNKMGWQQLAHGILGRNGLSGRTNALDGSSDNSDYIGRELDNDLLNELFISKEAKTWRDSNDYASVPDINKRLKERDDLAKENTSLKEQVKKLQEQIDNGADNGKFKKVVSTSTDLYIKE